MKDRGAGVNPILGPATGGLLKYPKGAWSIYRKKIKVIYLVKWDTYVEIRDLWTFVAFENSL